MSIREAADNVLDDDAHGQDDYRRFANPGAGEAPDEGPDPMAASMAEAEWAMRRLRRIRRQITEINQTVDVIISEARAWAVDETLPLLADATTAEVWLTNWMTARLERDPKTPKTCQLPSGKVKTTAGSTVLDVADTDGFVAWAQAKYPGLVRQPDPPPPAADKAAIKAAIGQFLMVAGDDAKPGAYPLVDTDGEAVPGVVFTRNERTFKVTVEEAS